MSMQYKGSVTIGSTDLFVTGATLNLARSPISPEIVWGAGWKVNYASGHFDPTFTVTFPWFQSYGTSLLNQAINENVSGTGTRNTPTTANLYNGGFNVAFTGVRVASISFRADAISNTALECSATFAATGATVSTTNPGATSPPANVDGQTPVPAYLMTATGVVNGVTIASALITAFDVTVNNNVFKLYTLNGSPLPADVQLGYIGVNGSYTFYTGGSPAIAITSSITSGSFSVSGGGISFAIPSVLYTSFASDITGPNNKPMGVAGFEGFGTASTPPVT